MEEPKPSECYVAMFQALESMIIVLDRASEISHNFDSEIVEMRDRIENVADNTIRLAVKQNWNFAYRTGGINPLFEDFNNLASRMVDHPEF